MLSWVYPGKVSRDEAFKKFDGPGWLNLFSEISSNETDICHLRPLNIYG